MFFLRLTQQLAKKIPDAPAGKPQIFEQEKQVYGRLQK